MFFLENNNSVMDKKNVFYVKTIIHLYFGSPMEYHWLQFQNFVVFANYFVGHHGLWAGHGSMVLDNFEPCVQWYYNYNTTFGN